MRTLGLDVGSRRIGVAISDALGLSAQRLTVVARRGPRVDAAAIVRLAEQHAVGAVVVGLPLTLRGERGPSVRPVEAFVDSLRQRMHIPIVYVDERLTTAESQRVMRLTNTSTRHQPGRLDEMAAQLILQQYLDRQRAEPVEPADG